MRRGTEPAALAARERDSEARHLGWGDQSPEASLTEKRNQEEEEACVIRLQYVCVYHSHVAARAVFFIFFVFVFLHVCPARAARARGAQGAGAPRARGEPRRARRGESGPSCARTTVGPLVLISPRYNLHALTKTIVQHRGHCHTYCLLQSALTHTHAHTIETGTHNDLYVSYIAYGLPRTGADR